MKRIFEVKFGWLILLVLLVIVNYLASQIHFRLDLTQEKRYTLSAPTKRLLRGLKEPVTITVLLDGNLPAGFKKLSGSASELLQEFREIAGNKLQFKFEKPTPGGADSARGGLYDSLAKLGINPTNVKAQTKSGESSEQTMLFPGAVIKYKDRVEGVDLLKGQSFEGGLNSLNKAEALLEYKFGNAIEKIVTDSLPLIGYLTGNGEPLTYNVYDLIERTLKPNYPFGILPIDSVGAIPTFYSALLIVKPTKAFTDNQKLRLDQYVTHGGKIIWLLDELYAEMDSLQRTKSDFVAFDRGLNLEDLLFNYGVRINQDLVMDLQCERVPLVVGNVGNQPQVEFLPWPYFPLLSSYSNHPISKNLDLVLSIFANSIDTVEAPGIRKTVLLASSSNSKTLSTPAIVSWNSTKVEENQQTYTRSHIPVAVLLEGKFTSLYSHRISESKKDTLARLYHQEFLPEAPFSGSMIVVSDADLVMNVVTQNEGPLPMGMHQFNKYQYANKDFLLNCIEYLTNNSGILETRSKDYTLRLLDTTKVDAAKTNWQLINIGLPIMIVILFGAFYNYSRKRKYEV